MKLHEKATKARTTRVLQEDVSWKKWMAKHPDWDTGAWDALSARPSAKPSKTEKHHQGTKNE